MLEVVNPFDLKPVGAVPETKWEVIDGYLDTAHQLFRNRKNC